MNDDTKVFFGKEEENTTNPQAQMKHPKSVKLKTPEELEAMAVKTCKTRGVDPDKEMVTTASFFSWVGICFGELRGAIEHLQRQILEKKTNLTVIKEYLSSGKFLVLPPSLYDRLEKEARGDFTDEEWSNIHKQKPLPTE